jgi:hypothetical protein
MLRRLDHYYSRGRVVGDLSHNFHNQQSEVSQYYLDYNRKKQKLLFLMRVVLYDTTPSIIQGDNASLRKSAPPNP